MAQTCCNGYGFGLDTPYTACCSTEFTTQLDCFSTCQALNAPMPVMGNCCAEYTGEPGTRNVCNDRYAGGCTTVCGPEWCPVR